MTAMTPWMARLGRIATPLWVGMWCLWAALAVQAAPSTTTAAAPPAAEATLTYFNRPLFTFRDTLSGISAADRAKRAQARIHDQLALVGPYTVTQKPDALGVLVQINGATAFVVTPGDADATLEETATAAAQRAASALQLAITESAESRNLESMLRSAAQALGATALALALFWAAGRLSRRLSKHLVALTQKHSERIVLGGATLLQRDRVARGVVWLQVAVFRLLAFVLAYEWLSFVLSRFPYTRVWGETLNSFLLNLLGQFASAVAGALPGMFTALVIFFLARALSGGMDRFFQRVQDGQIQVQWLDADVALPTRRIAKAVLWLFALAMAYPYLPGSETEAFKGLSVLAGLMISLGASSLVGQAASGMILTYSRVYRKGEYVRIAEHEGTVTDVGMFATRIRTGLGEELTISNSTILGATTKNYSRVVRGEGFVLDTSVTIGYDTPWRQVHALLMEAARRTEGVLADPAPQVFQTALSDWYPQYRLVCQAIPAEPRPRALLLSALHGHIQDVFNEYGVQIMSPQYFEDPASPKLVPPDRWYEAPAVKPPQP